MICSGGTSRLYKHDTIELKVQGPAQDGDKRSPTNVSKTIFMVAERKDLKRKKIRENFEAGIHSVFIVHLASV